MVSEPQGHVINVKHAMDVKLVANVKQRVCAGTSKNHKDAASIRTTHPIPASCGVYYFEVKVISKGRDGLVVICCHISTTVLLTLGCRHYGHELRNSTIIFLTG